MIERLRPERVRVSCGGHSDGPRRCAEYAVGRSTYVNETGGKTISRGVASYFRALIFQSGYGIDSRFAEVVFHYGSIFGPVRNRRDAFFRVKRAECVSRQIVRTSLLASRFPNRNISTASQNRRFDAVGCADFNARMLSSRARRILNLFWRSALVRFLSARSFRQNRKLAKRNRVR